MRTFAAILVCLALAVTARSQTAPTCVNGNLTDVAFTVIDRNGVAPTDVKKEDLTLKINGEPTSVVDLKRQNDLPIDLAIFIDVSLSQEKALRLTKPTAKALIQELLRFSDNRVALISFSNQVHVEKSLTSNVALLLAALDEVQIIYPPGYIGGGAVITSSPPQPKSQIPGSTSLWDTSTAAMEDVFPGPRDHGRQRVVLLLTDGEDTASQGKLKAAIKTALDHGVVVYALGVQSWADTVKRDSLKKIAEETGGAATFAKKREDVVEALREIGSRLASQYVLSFCSDAQKAGPLKLRLDLTNPKFRDARLAYRRQ
jgi:VWFA-related protein